VKIGKLVKKAQRGDTQATWKPRKPDACLSGKEIFLIYKLLISPWRSCVLVCLSVTFKLCNHVTGFHGSLYEH
jgi:hypothetical protein